MLEVNYIWKEVFLVPLPTFPSHQLLPDLCTLQIFYTRNPVRANTPEYRNKHIGVVRSEKTWRGGWKFTFPTTLTFGKALGHQRAVKSKWSTWHHVAHSPELQAGSPTSVLFPRHVCLTWSLISPASGTRSSFQEIEWALCNLVVSPLLSSLNISTISPSYYNNIFSLSLISPVL